MGISQHLIRVTNTFSHFIHGHYSKQALAKIFLPRMHSILGYSRWSRDLPHE